MYLRAAVELSPEVAKYKSYLGVAIAGQGKGFTAAERCCTEAIEMEIYNPDHYVNLGLVYRSKGEKDKAKARFEQALQWSPRNRRALKELEKMEGRKKGILQRLLNKRG